MEQTLGKRIVSNRKRLGMTQDQLAEKLGVTAQAVSKWENDQSCPDISVLPRLAEIFGISTDELLGYRSEKVYEAEVVEEEDSGNADGLHFRRGNWDFHWDNSKKDAIGLAVMVLAVGVLYLLSQIFMWKLSFWDILWPTALLVFGLFGLFPKFSFFRLGCLLLGSYFLLKKLVFLPFAVDTGIVWAVVILLFGLSLLADILRKARKPGFHVNYSQDSDRHHKATNNYEAGKDSFRYETGFGENHQVVSLPQLRCGEISTNFGDFTVDLSGVETVAEDCKILAKCSFGELKLLVPRRYAVKPFSSTAFAAFTTKGQPEEHPCGQILLDANVSFGEIQLIYI